MGYFPNGTSGVLYQEEFCSRCVNWRDLGDGRSFGCPIFDLHSLWNYDAVGTDGDAIKAEALEHFIPMDGIQCGQCTMFQEAMPGLFTICSRCDNPTADPVEKIEGRLCSFCAKKLENNLLLNPK